MGYCEDVEVDTLSNWITSCRTLMLKRINKLKCIMKDHASSIFKDKDVVDNLMDLQDKYVIVPADKVLTISFSSARNIILIV